MENNNVCYFFGTFNPVHLGHIEIARKVREKYSFDKVIFVPSFMPPHKSENLAPYKQRLEMVRLAVGSQNVSDIEGCLSPPSYTYRTIEKLHSGKKINFIIGYDQFFKIESWREPDILKEKVHFLLFPRHFQNGQTMSDRALEYLKNKGFSFSIVDTGFLDISSSQIRKLLAEGCDITGLTTPEVKEYIENNRLYYSLAQKKIIG